MTAPRNDNAPGQGRVEGRQNSYQKRSDFRTARPTAQDGFRRELLPDAQDYYEHTAGLTFRERRGKWRTTGCPFHGSSDSLRINVETGAFVCMAACGARGGDVLSFHMAAHGLTFIEAAKRLGAWVDDGRPPPARPMPFSARDGLSVLADEVALVAIAASNVAHGVMLSDGDLERLRLAAARIIRVAEVCA